MRSWQLQEAETRLSELVKLAERAGPQELTLDGQAIAVVLSRSDFARLPGNGQSLIEFMRRSPLYGVEELDLERKQSATREAGF